MGQWLSSREFALRNNIVKKSLQKACFRAKQRDKNFCILKFQILYFRYVNGVGGNSGKVLQIWSEPFNSIKEAEAFLHNYRVAMLERAVKQSKLDVLESSEALLHTLDSNNALLHTLAKNALLNVSHNQKQTDTTRDVSHTLNMTRNIDVSAASQHDKRAESIPLSITYKDMQIDKGIDSKQNTHNDTREIQGDRFFATAQNDGSEAYNNLGMDCHETPCVSCNDNTIESIPSEHVSNNEITTNAMHSWNERSEIQNDIRAIHNDGDNTQSNNTQRDTHNDKKPSNNTQMPYENLTPFDFATTKARRIALEKKRVVKEWESLKKKGVLAKDFIAFVNANRDSNGINEAWLNKAETKSITQRNTGLDGLLDTRGYTREGISKIQELGLDVLIDKLLLASRGRINISSIHNQLHIYLDSMGLHSYEDFLAKKSEYVSYNILVRYIRQWKRNNVLPTSIIHKGEDKVIGNFSPALGNKSANITRINERVEIDSTKLDVIINIADLARTHGLAITKEDRESWQKRYCLIGLIDVYSGVRCYHLSDTENSTGIARAIAKYISLYGKPECLVTDNGRAFKSKELQEILVRLDIKHSTTKAYSGQDKPFIERSFGELQNHLSEWVRGYIGHNVEQRTAIESFFSRATRRLKRGQKSNIKDLYTLQEMQKSIDSYTTILNNKYSQRLEKTHREAYNEQSSEAIAINPHILHSHLSKLQLRRVNKKGIMYGGIYYSTPSLFNHTSVYVAQNINNIHELYVYDTKYNFIDIAHNACAKEISVEEAKMAQKVFKRVLKDIKTDMEITRDSVEHELKILRDTISMKLPKTTQPKVPAINNINMEVALNQSKARRASGDGLLEIADKALQYQEDKREIKRDLSFEAAVLNLSKNKETTKK